MATKAFQKIYTKITQITKATCSLKATGVGYDELATVDGKLAQVVKIAGDDVTLQVFEGTEGIPTNAEVVFLGKSPTLKVSEQLAGRFFNAFGDPIDGGPDIEGQEVEIYEPVGCPNCDNSGYRGRIGVYEIMEVNNDVKRCIAKGGDADAIKDVALQNGMSTLRMSATRYVLQGITSVSEMIKVSFES